MVPCSNEDLSNSQRLVLLFKSTSPKLDLSGVNKIMLY